MNRKDAELIYNLIIHIVGLQGHPDSRARIREARKEFFGAAVDADEKYMEIRNPERCHPNALQQRREMVKAIGLRYCPDVPAMYDKISGELDSALNEVEQAVKAGMCVNHTQCQNLLKEIHDDITVSLDFAEGKIQNPPLGLDSRSLQHRIREMLK